MFLVYLKELRFLEESDYIFGIIKLASSALMERLVFMGISLPSQLSAFKEAMIIRSSKQAAIVVKMDLNYFVIENKDLNLP